MTPLCNTVPDIKTALRAVPMSLFSTYSSLQEVVDLAESRLPIKNQNDMVCLLMSYHNTLLSTVSK